ncbi:MAG: GNAT family N-acetyltransferase, partial [Clostridia bacterium]|nr:GNAT family N-acetyltransferase [Clostridia bacterium]
MRGFALCADRSWLMSQEAYSVYAPCMYKPSYTAYAERMERFLADPHVLTFVCEEDGEKTGMLVLDTSADIPEIAGIAVPEARRRMGFGSFMIRQLMNAGYVDKLLARTDDSAVGFYRKCGFSVEEQTIAYPDGPCVRYICKLLPKGAPLEEMGAFFDARLEGYEEHQLTCIESAQEFYPYTAQCLPGMEGSRILDLGCGTGLELGYYFDRVPAARVTGIDLAPGMLEALRQKYPDKDLELIQGSYFDVPFDE